MMQYQKQPAMIHLGYAAGGGTSIQYENDKAAEATFDYITKLKTENDPHKILNLPHGVGCVHVELSFVKTWAWTREQRVAAPILGGAGGLPQFTKN
jgi:hypothetical protein